MKKNHIDTNETVPKYVYEIVRNRLLHLLESPFIRSFDEVEPITGKYKRDIADAAVMAQSYNQKIIRCKDCKYCTYDGFDYACTYQLRHQKTTLDDFCSHAEQNKIKKIWHEKE